MSEHTLADATVISMKAWDRKDADFYPTPGDVTQALLDALGPQKAPLKIWEPACGTGEMSRVLRYNGHGVYSSDIRHTGYGRAGVDFLKVRLHPDSDEIDAIISNPPFTLAEEFIRCALEHAPLVAMLLKSNYWHTKRGKALFADHPPTMEYKLTWRPAFLAKERGNSPLMDCSWNVWRKNAAFTAGWRPIARPVDALDVSDKPLAVSLVMLGDAMQKLSAALNG
jgi:hypothetical protein